MKAPVTTQSVPRPATGANIVLEYPHLEMRGIELVETAPLVRGPVGKLVDRMQFGGPLAAAMGVDDVHDDPDLITFIRQESETARFVLIHSAVDFHADRGEPDLESAAVRITLTGGAGESSVISWSLSPASAATPFEANSSFSVGPKVKILGADLSLGEMGGGKTRHREDVFLQATGILTSKPAWEFQRRPAIKLEGSYRLVLVARAPVRQPAQLTVALDASVISGFGPRRFRKTVELDAEDGPTAILTF